MYIIHQNNLALVIIYLYSEKYWALNNVQYML